MVDNLQDTSELLVSKLYVKIRTARLDSLSRLKIATEDGLAVCTSTITYYRKMKLLDYITTYIHNLTIISETPETTHHKII